MLERDNLLSCEEITALYIFWAEIEQIRSDEPLTSILSWLDNPVFTESGVVDSPK